MSRPNVVVVLTDQQRWDTVGAYDSPMNLTPNLDRLAREGTLCSTAISPQPVCGPARACLQTGQYATTNGVWMNGIQLPDSPELLATQFNQHGYQTAYVGKWHLGETGSDPVPKERRGGYEDYWRAADIMELTSQPYESLIYDEDNEPIYLDGYRTDVIMDQAISFVSSHAEEPFFLFVSIFEPHNQSLSNEFVAPDGYAEQYKNPYVPGDLEGVPGDWYESLPAYYGSCARIDECVGRLVRSLRTNGLYENTILTYTSDHGCHFRTRNREHKRSCHESSIRVPLIFHGPGFWEHGSFTPPVNLIDLPPTLLDAANIDPPQRMEGTSILGEMNGETSDWREDVYIEISESEIGRAIRTKRWTYAVGAPNIGGRDAPASDTYRERYLYDRFADPHQRLNLIGRYDYRDVADRLRERLLDRMEPSIDSDPQILPADIPTY